MKKTIILGLMALACSLGAAVAQNGFNLPYSQFGIGSSELPYNMPMVSRMGGAVYTLSGNNFVNPFNPASYGGIEKESFVFDIGFNIQLNTQRSGSTSLKDANGNVGYLAVGLPVTKWWKLVGGLMPHSTVGYRTVTSQTDTNSYGTMRTIYSGDNGESVDGQINASGVTQIFLGSAFNIPAWSGADIKVGFNAKYLTGRIMRAISYEFTDNTTTYWVNSRRLKETQVRNIVFDFGLQFRQALGEKYTIGLGLTYKPYQDMTVKDMALIYTYQYGTDYLLDTIFPARGEDPYFNSRLEQPHTFGVGLSIERNKRWLVAADATFASWNGLRYTEDEAHAIFGQTSLRSDAFSRYALAYEWLGNMDASTYWGRISWSLGVHAEQGTMYLNLNDGDYRVDGWGVGAGMSLPMRKGRSLLTISAGYSSMGSADVLKRECVTFGIAVSSCERWFVKRKYN